MHNNHEFASQTQYYFRTFLYFKVIWLSWLLIFFLSSSFLLGEELQPSESSAPAEKSGEAVESQRFLSDFGQYFWSPEVWGVIDEARFAEEETLEVKAHRWGNRFLFRTPLGAFLWGYERGEGKAALFPRRNNVFGGRLHKQPFEWGRQDKREYGYFIDTKRLRRWLEDEPGVPKLKLLQPFDIQGYFIYTDSDASVGERGEINFANEKFESIDSQLNFHVNRGRWFGLGFEFSFIRYNPTTLSNFKLFDSPILGPQGFTQKEVIDRDVWHAKITFPVSEKIHISGLYDEDNDIHRFKNTDIPSVPIPFIGNVPLFLIPNRSMHSTQRKFGPEVRYFFDEDLYRAVSMGFYAYTGESAGRLGEFGLKRAFRWDSAGQFASLDLHNSFGLSIGYDEYEKRANSEDEKKKKWGIGLEAGYLDSDEVSGPFSGLVFVTPGVLPQVPPPGVPTLQIRQFDEDLKQLFFKGNFIYHIVPNGNKSHALAGELHTDFSYWNLEREGKQSSTFPLLGASETIRSFRDDRRILQFEVGYELDKPLQHRFGGLYSIEMDFNWDVEGSDKVGGLTLGFFY